jgi:hypothetical protein
LKTPSFLKRRDLRKNKNKEEAGKPYSINYNKKKDRPAPRNKSKTSRDRLGSQPIIYITQLVVDIVNLLLREGDQSPGKGKLPTLKS